ncbi:hypothetical protein KKC59_01590 [bacterium]|nr:hypothetical protein [bacterium]
MRIIIFVFLLFLNAQNLFAETDNKAIDFDKIKQAAYELAGKIKDFPSSAIEKAVMVEAKINMSAIRKGEEAFFAENEKYTSDISKLSIRPSAYENARFSYVVQVFGNAKKYPYVIVATRSKGEFKGSCLVMYPDGVVKGTGRYVDMVD